MIKESKLNEIAALRRLTPKNAEKEYFQELMLYSLYSMIGKKLVFKGGTCLYKIYKLNRFSEDLDFDAAKGIDSDKTIKKSLYNLKLLGINSSVKYLDSFEKGINVGINFNGPLYDGTKESLCFLLLNISTRQRPALKPRLERITSIYKEFPDFDVFTMDPKEILAEKITAIHNREKPRDVYDVWFLLKNMSVELDKKLVKKKLKKELDKDIFMKKVLEKERYWEGELGKLVIGKLPPFSSIRKEIEDSL
jgi:predicted nucleotidyltransferase component of viral defense system